MKIGVIGSGNVGRGVAGLWLRAGHHVRFGGRRPEALAGLVEGLGPHASAGTAEEAAGFGEVVFCATPYGAWPALAPALLPHLAGKVVVDAANPYPGRDGAFAQEAIDAGQGAGVPVAALLPGVGLVRAFNCVPWPAMVAQAHRPGTRIAVPLAGDDPAARGVAAGLVRDAGFEPVDAGALARARGFDPGGPAYNRPMDADAMRRTLGLVAPGVASVPVS